MSGYTKETVVGMSACDGWADGLWLAGACCRGTGCWRQRRHADLPALVRDRPIRRRRLRRRVTHLASTLAGGPAAVGGAYRQARRGLHRPAFAALSRQRWRPAAGGAVRGRPAGAGGQQLSYLIFPLRQRERPAQPGQLRGGRPVVRRWQPAVHPRRTRPASRRCLGTARRVPGACCIRISGTT